MIMKKELKRRIITVIVGAVIMCMVSLVPEMVQAYASTNAVSEDAGIRAEYNGDSGVLTLDVSTNKAMIDFGLEDKKPWTNFNVISKTFTISQADITKATVTLAANSYTYSGSYFKPAVTVAYGSAKLKASDYTVQYANNKEPGTATVTITANGSNCVSGKRVVKNFRIEKKVPVISFKSPISTTWHNANGTHGFECVAPSDCQGTFSFKSSNPKLLAINAAGGRVQVMNNKAFGSVVITATFTPKGADAAHYSTKSITRTIKVVPNIVKIANTESKKSGQLYIQWSNSKKEYNASEYRIYYYGYKKDSEDCGQMSLYNSKSKITGTSTTITGLKAGKYYIKVVPCYKSGGNVQNGASTSAVKCVIK